MPHDNSPVPPLDLQSSTHRSRAFHLPHTLHLIPPRFPHPMPKPDVLLHSTLHRPILHILPNLLATTIKTTPLRVPPETPLVRVTRNIARAARVAVLEPGAPDVGVLLVDGEGNVRKLARGFEGDIQARGTGTDDEDADGARGVRGLLGDGVRGVEVAVPFVLVRLGKGGWRGDFGT